MEERKKSSVQNFLFVWQTEYQLEDGAAQKIKMIKVDNINKIVQTL